jgi:hypothetical protein
LVALLWSATQQQPIAGQRLGVGVVLGTFEFLKLGDSLLLGPAMLFRLRQSAPPDFIGEAKRPGRVIGRQANQAVAPFFFLR